MTHDFVRETQSMLEDFFAKIPMNRGELLVLGMSSSEAAGGVIGRASAPEIGEQVVSTILSGCAARGIHLATQCCEHLNRALVIERSTAAARFYTAVSAVPHPTAGGSAAAAAYALLSDPVLVETVAADAGIDIGVTMIGMHLRRVAVPVRTNATIGNARVDFAFARPPLIGGERARY